MDSFVLRQVLVMSLRIMQLSLVSAAELSASLRVSVGCFLTGVFAEKEIGTMSGGAAIPGGWVDGNVNSFFKYHLSYFVVSF